MYPDGGCEPVARVLERKTVMTMNLETANGFLPILAEGCRRHPAYRAQRRPGIEGCETCDGMYEARQALDASEAMTAEEPA